MRNLSATWIVPDWPAPSNVRAVSTTRAGGVSRAPFDDFNLADHVGDDPDAVAANRRRLAKTLNLSAEPLWLKQVHGNRVVDAARAQPQSEADAAVTFEPGPVCAVLTADCLPVLFCDRQGVRVAAVHAGWRGLAAGVLEAAVEALESPPPELLVWLGPAIGPRAFEVGDEVRSVFVAHDPAGEACFNSSSAGRWLADIHVLARLRLNAMGITAVYGGGWCTYSDAERFYSYRRDKITGRMASLITLL